MKISQSQSRTQSTFETKIRYILDENFLSIAEMESAHGVTYTPKQKALLVEKATDMMPQLLRAFKFDCVLLPTLPQECNLIQLLKRHPLGMDQQYKRWFESLFVTFAHEELLPSCEWLIVRLDAFPCSTFQTWSAQEGTLPSFAYVPSAVELVHAMMSVQMVRGTRLFTETRLRTSSVDQCGQRVTVDNYGPDGLDVNYFWDSGQLEDVGLAAALKPVAYG